MKPTIKKVNPKAGTLKLTNNAVWNNVSRKLIAFVLMLGLTLTNLAFVQEDDSLGKDSSNPGGATATTVNKADTCCTTEKGKTMPIERKSVKLALPSVEMVRKADSEALGNLFASLREQDNFVTPLMINLADLEIKSNFDSGVFDKISIPAKSAVSNADKTVDARFIAENVGISTVASKMFQSADEEMSASFTAKNVGETTQKQSVVFTAESEINNNFQADNSYQISTPSAKSFASADEEITSNIYKDTNGKGIVKTSKKGRK